MVAYGEYIKIFRPDHLIFIAGLILIAVLFFHFRDPIRENRDLITRIILIVSLGQQILLYTSYFYIMKFDLGESLPFHISRINSILGIIYLVTKNKKIFSILPFFSMYAWTSFLYPARVYGMTHPLGISFFINHVVTLLLPFYAIHVFDERIVSRDKFKAFGWFVLYLGFVMIINPIVDGNYFYLKHKPLLGFLPDPIYIPLVLLFTMLLFMLGERIYIAYQVLITRTDAETATETIQ